MESYDESMTDIAESRDIHRMSPGFGRFCPKIPRTFWTAPKKGYELVCVIEELTNSCNFVCRCFSTEGHSMCNTVGVVRSREMFSHLSLDTI